MSKIQPAVMDLIEAFQACKGAQDHMERCKKALEKAIISREVGDDPVGTWQYLGHKVVIPSDWNNDIPNVRKHFDVTEIEMDDKVIVLDRAETATK